MSRAARTPTPLPKLVKIACECGHTIRAEMGHYDIVRCVCQKFWWLLQPKRDGPLVASPWPGLPVAPLKGGFNEQP